MPRRRLAARQHGAAREGREGPLAALLGAVDGDGNACVDGTNYPGHCPGGSPDDRRKGWVRRKIGCYVAVRYIPKHLKFASSACGRAGRWLRWWRAVGAPSRSRPWSSTSAFFWAVTRPRRSWPAGAAPPASSAMTTPPCLGRPSGRSTTPSSASSWPAPPSACRKGTHGDVLSPC